MNSKFIFIISIIYYKIYYTCTLYIIRVHCICTTCNYCTYSIRFKSKGNVPYIICMRIWIMRLKTLGWFLNDVQVIKILQSFFRINIKYLFKIKINKPYTTSKCYKLNIETQMVWKIYIFKLFLKESFFKMKSVVNLF